jgi:uncharacterized protein YuzE
MVGSTFGNDRNSFIWLPAYDGANNRLYKSTWEFKTLHAERAHLAQNFDLVKETLRNPELVRLSEKDPDCFLAYRQFDQYSLGQGRQGSVVLDTYLAVVVDRVRGDRHLLPLREAQTRNDTMAAKNPKMTAAYDENADVLYVSFGTGEPSNCEEVDDLVLFEVGLFSHRPTGFQIIGFKKHVKDFKFSVIEKTGKSLLRAGTRRAKKDANADFQHMLRRARHKVSKLIAA